MTEVDLLLLSTKLAFYPEAILLPQLKWRSLHSLGNIWASGKT